MKHRSAFGTGALAIACSLSLLTASGAPRPVRQNKDYNPAAASTFPFVTTGVQFKIKSASIAKDGTITTRVTIQDSKGQGLDINGVQTPGTLTVRLVAAYIPSGQSQYVAYTTSVLTAFINKNPSQTVAGTDSGGTFTLVDAATGTYDYVFKTKAPANFDGNATHTIGGQAERSLTDFGIEGAYADDDAFSFVPNGGTPNARDVVNEKSCNSCHNPISAHGGGRKTMLYCVLCHTPQSTNPDTYNTVDMRVFIHKLHMGQNLPSVKAGTKYIIVHRQAVIDYSDIAFPQDIRNCTVCHAAGPKSADNWKTNPSRAACGSCHDNVNFATGENHVSLPQLSDNGCKNCHVATAEMDRDASIPGAHVVPNQSASLPGIVLQVVKVENTIPGAAPTVTLKVTDKKGNPVDPTKLTTFRVVISGPNVDYQTGDGGVRVSETPTAATLTGKDGVYTYTMATKIPAAAKGSYTVSLQARNSVTLLAGTQKQVVATDMAIPVEYYFTVDSSKLVARRKVVSNEKCAACHANLGFVHGGTRGNVQECAVCHNPTLVDTTGASANFAWMVHSIHRGEALENPYVIGGANYQEVLFPGDLRDCTSCHLAGTYQVDNIGAKANVTSKTFLTSTGPIAAACQGCHDDIGTAAHALSQTNSLGESCKVCHGNGTDFSVDAVHERH